MMMDPQWSVYIVGVLAFVTIGALGFVFGGSGVQTAPVKRVKAVATSGGRGRATDANASRRKQLDATLKGLKDKEAQRKKTVAGRSVADKLMQAGLTLPPVTFHLISAGAGAACGVGLMIAGMSPLVAAGAAFAGGLGVPRWVLGMMISARQKKFVGQFADAIDVIVRGVKSGLPLNECLRIIAAESPQPLKGEFERVVDGLSMGASFEQALSRMYQRMPIQEVNFFNIVLAIQQRAGGNLSEALGNLSSVLRSRKLLREKIKALSSEAKASAMIIGSLPIIVMLLVYLTTPGYIMELFTNQLGHMILLLGAVLMGMGIYIMRQMINFDF